MISTTSPNKPVHFFRRFWEGWFSVYLSIFLVTLAVRLFLFQTNDSSTPVLPVAQAGITVKAHQLFHSSISHIVNSPRLDVVQQNQVSFEQQNELTQN